MLEVGTRVNRFTNLEYLRDRLQNVLEALLTIAEIGTYPPLIGIGKNRKENPWGFGTLTFTTEPNNREIPKYLCHCIVRPKCVKKRKGDRHLQGSVFGQREKENYRKEKC